MKVAVFMHTYLPGFRAGGPTLSVSQILQLSPGWEFIVFAANRDLGQASAYPGLEDGGVGTVGDVPVVYLRSPGRDALRLRRSLRSIGPDCYYLNSLHDFNYSWIPLLALRLRLLPPAQLLLAPRGECAPAALAVSSWKKRIARVVLPFMIPRSVIWHASSLRELDEIKAWLPSRRREQLSSVIAPDPGPVPWSEPSEPPDGPMLEVTFLSRLHPIKGLTDAIAAMAQVTEPCRLSIYGVIEDPQFWAACQQQIAQLPAGSQVEYHGEYTPAEAQGILGGSDLMVLPTRSENFGRVIAEALSVGCPVLLPDTTMWTGVIRDGGGIVVSDAASIAVAIDRVARMSVAERAQLRTRVWQAYRDWFQEHVGEFSPFVQLASRPPFTAQSGDSV